MIEGLLLVIAIGVLLLSDTGKSILQLIMISSIFAACLAALLFVGFLAYIFIEDYILGREKLEINPILGAVLAIGSIIYCLGFFVKTYFSENVSTLEDGTKIYSPSDFMVWKNRPLEFVALKQLWKSLCSGKKYAGYLGLIALVSSLTIASSAIEKNKLWWIPAMGASIALATLLVTAAVLTIFPLIGHLFRLIIKIFIRPT